MTRSDAMWACAWGGLLGALAAAMRGFTVDDALISVQYARNIAHGAGYRFDAAGPSTDGVTPLPWPLLLAPLARADAMTVLGRAQLLGVACWSVAAAALGVAVGRARASLGAKLAALALTALSLPIAAHAASGMETGVVMAFATFAVAFHDSPRVSTAAAAFAAALRPELGPWALVFCAGRALAQEARPAGVAAHALSSVSGLVGCALIRSVAFGHPYPLSLLAKPSDFDHGASYVIAALAVSALPIACLAPWALWRGADLARAVVVAFAAHALVVALVGGDWMPFARLIAPVIPSLALALVYCANTSSRASLVVRASLGAMTGLYFWVIGAPRAATVRADRADLAARAAPILASCTQIATVDVGWVSAASRGHIVDLAGLTDPQIAVLPGGHTSKRVDAAMLLDRRVDCALFYVEPGFRAVAQGDGGSVRFAHAVSARLAQSELFATHFKSDAMLALGAGDRGYVLFRERK